MSVYRFWRIGAYRVNIFGLATALGCLIGTHFILREARRRGYDPDKILNLVLAVISGGIVGARVMYVILNLKDYLPNLPAVLQIWRGGLSFHGGIAGGALVGLGIARREGYRFWELADMFAPAIAIAYAVARLGCDIYGKPTSLWLGVTVYGVSRHPVQLYSAITSFGIFVFLWSRRERVKYPGQQFLLYGALYSITRFGVEFFREGVMVGGVLTAAQFTSIITLLAAFGGSYWLGQAKAVPRQGKPCNTMNEYSFRR